MSGWAHMKSQLMEHAPEIECMQSRKVEYYLSQASNIREQARQYLSRQEYEKGYIYMLRFCNMVQYTLKNHKQWKNEKYAREQKKIRTQMMNALDVLEKLTAILQQKYDNVQDEEEDVEQEQEESKKLEQNRDEIVEEKKIENHSTEKGIIVASDVDRWANLRIPDQNPSSPKGSMASSEKISRHMGNILKLEQVKVPLDLMEVFLKIAFPNTQKDVETCGILTGKLIGNGYQVTHVIWFV
jgi:hypothetical protein